MRVESAARLVDERLGHEGGKIAVLMCQLLDEGAKHHDIVGGLQRLAIADIYLHLARRIFRIGLFDGNASLVDLLADGAKHMLHLRSPNERIDLDVRVTRLKRFRLGPRKKLSPKESPSGR